MLFLKDRIDESVEILRTFEPPEGYYLAFSGGKDSIVLYAMAKLAGVKFDAHYNVTTADPPELIKFIRKFYPDVKWERSGWTMWTLIPHKLMPPTRLARYCCEFLKEGGGEGRVVLTGVKRSDSTNRRKTFVHSCRKNGRVVVAPLVNWCDDEIWAYIKDAGLAYCELYDQGFTRLGCIGCPMAGAKRQKEEFERWPKFRAAYVRAFGRMIVERNKRGKDIVDKGNWDTPENVMSWWLQDETKEDLMSKPKEPTMEEMVKWLEFTLGSAAHGRMGNAIRAALLRLPQVEQERDMYYIEIGHLTDRVKLAELELKKCQAEVVRLWGELSRRGSL